MTRFEPHGRITAHLAGRILFFETTGPFNAEVVEAVVRAYEPLVKSVAGTGRFGHISVFHRSMLATPDTLEALNLLLGEWRQSGFAPIGNAYVADDSVEGRNIMMPVFAKVFEGFGRFRDFHRIADAEAWIAELLADEP